MVTVWILFAPMQFGGNVAYVILSGNSMSPKFWQGDLVLVRSQSTYQTGDAVAYEHPQIGYVFHRIIDIDIHRKFTLQGDHNDWTDSYYPNQEDIIGKLWIHIPRLGKTLKTLRSPWGFAILVLVFSLFFLITLTPRKENRRNKKKRGEGNFMSSSQQNSGETLFILAILALGAFVLGIASFRQPLHNKIETPISYNQQAFFRYTANVPEGIYDSPQVQSGEPIFRQLNGSFAVTMDYLFISPDPSEINGTYHFLARVSDDRGWKRTLELIPETTFTGNVFTASGILDLDDIQIFIDTLERETGVQRGRYNLSVLAEVEIVGSLAELNLEDNFNPSLNFQIDDLEVRLLQNNTGENNILSPTLVSALTRVTYERNHLNIFGMQIAISFARWASLLIGLPALLMLFISLFRIFQATQQNELERLRVWYGSMLIEARYTQLLTKPDRVEIASLDDLANLAEQDQRTILHLPDSNQHHFFVQTAEQLYHYEMEETSTSLEIIQEKQEKKIKQKWQLPFLMKKNNNNVWDAYEHALKGWAKAVDNKLYSQGQADQIADMAYKLALALDIRGAELEEIRMAAYLHKIGLMDVPSEVLQKKNKLTEAEFELIRNHPAYARDQLSGTELLKPIAESIYYQHERWDGSGYPEGLEGEEIPIGARIIAVVNIWNALHQKRPHRDIWEHEKIHQYFREQAGNQFDPHIIKVFLDMILEQDDLNNNKDSEIRLVSTEGK